MTLSSSVASLSFLCLLVLLLPTPHGASSQASSYKLGSRQVFFRTPASKSSGNSQQASTVPTAAPCSLSIAAGLDNKKLPVVHRQSPCSRLHGQPSLTAADVLRRDNSHIRRRFSSQSSSSLAAATAPSPAATMITANASSMSRLPGALDYSVLVSYGTPEQQFPVFLDTSSIGASLLRCKPCASSGSGDCDPAFDTSQSSTFADVLCGSPDCPTNCSGGGAGSGACPLDGLYSVINATYAEDVLTLAPSMAVHDFRFLCLAVDEPEDLPVAGTLDLGRDRNSLPSQLSSSSAAAAAFSYCLPQSPSSQGFLSLGVDAATRDANATAHAPLVSSGDPELASMYFIDLVGISLGDEDLSIPAGTFGNNDTNLDVGTTFTVLAPAAYAPLRDSFQKQMSQYNNVSSSPAVGFAGFDTCFNFTELDGLIVPNVEFKFGNGDSLMIYAHQMLYYDDPDAGPFTMTCLAFSSFNDSDAFSAVIGSYTLGSTEVVYDVAGGKVGFVPSSC